MTTPDTKRSAHKAGAFDIRTFIAMLIGLYGVILVLTGLFGTSDADLAKADGVNANLWTGIGLLVVGALFQGWAMARPIVVPDDVSHDRDTAH
ncbi:MAG TPA: hypothetical protein VLA97_16690 [Nocardioidaceae bacterium]|jgi:hypothetical protein|nr:hypothetical protein [Nocardioidaceae bacterium]